MATKVDNHLILPYHWIDSMCTDLAGNYNEELGREIIWYYVISANNIVKKNGNQILSNDPYVDVAVKGYLDQLDIMQSTFMENHSNHKGKRNGMSREEISKIIEDKARQGLTAKEIRDLLEEEYQVSYKSVSTVQKSDGWKKAHMK